MKKYHDIENVIFEHDEMKLFVDGKQYSFLLADISERLLHASQFEKEKFELSPSGYGIHWSLIDEDLSIDGLFGIKHQPEFLLKEEHH